MKQKDIALVLVMAFIGAVAAFVLSGWLFASPKNREQTAETVDVITSDFSEPPAKYFNASAVNPTQQIEIGGDGNPSPFNAKPQ